MLSYLANCIRPEIQMAVHQTARFSVNPMRSHELVIMQIGRYLSDNAESGIIYKVDKSKRLEVLEDGIKRTQKMLTMFFQELDLLFAMQTVQ
jgi:hypothetical protein